MTDPRDRPKIVQPIDEPIFGGEDTAKADTLDAVVSSASSSDNSSSTVQPDYLQKMRHLGNMVVDAFDSYFTQSSSSPVRITPLAKDSEAALFLVSFVHLERTRDSYAQVIFPDVKRATLKHFLESIYGPEMTQSGIYEAMELDKTEFVDSETISSFFPEFKYFDRFNQKEVQIRANPYQSVLSLPLQARPFFSGILETANVDIDNTTIWNKFKIPITTRQIMDHAKKNNELANVGQYLKMLSEAGVGI
ncbi:hypothetical protein J4437_06235 [Candidatus Woesearchaeota archaeon]|nr:hypothetical protein [Candidatus Woesearchaeota archaeon]